MTAVHGLKTAESAVACAGMGRLDSWTPGSYTAGGTTHRTFRKGAGPGVIVIHEIPGITPAVIAFAEDVVGGGFTVVMPSLFGHPGAGLTGPGGTSAESRPRTEPGRPRRCQGQGRRRRAALVGVDDRDRNRRVVQDAASHRPDDYAGQSVPTAAGHGQLGSRRLGSLQQRGHGVRPQQLPLHLDVGILVPPLRRDAVEPVLGQMLPVLGQPKSRHRAEGRTAPKLGTLARCLPFLPPANLTTVAWKEWT